MYKRQESDLPLSYNLKNMQKLLQSFVMICNKYKYFKVLLVDRNFVKALKMTSSFLMFRKYFILGNGQGCI